MLQWLSQDTAMGDVPVCPIHDNNSTYTGTRTHNPQANIAPDSSHQPTPAHGIRVACFESCTPHTSSGVIVAAAEHTPHTSSGVIVAAAAAPSAALGTVYYKQRTVMNMHVTPHPSTHKKIKQLLESLNHVLGEDCGLPQSGRNGRGR